MTRYCKSWEHFERVCFWFMWLCPALTHAPTSQETEHLTWADSQHCFPLPCQKPVQEIKNRMATCSHHDWCKTYQRAIPVWTWFLVFLVVTGYACFSTVKKNKIGKGVQAEISLWILMWACKQNCLMQTRLYCFASYFGFLLELSAEAFCWISTSSFPETVWLGRSPTGAIQAFITK